jgi:predicted ATP-grasp superfamily ATP-dependent carboligase
LSQKYPFKVYEKPELTSSSLIVGWNEDAGKLGGKVVDYLHKNLGCVEFAEIEPADFFPLTGVSVKDDVAQFPESRFYYCPKDNLVILKSDPPEAEWYRFLCSVLDIAEKYCHVNEVYTIGGMVSIRAHSHPRELLAIANSPQMKRVLSQYDLAGDFNYETPPGQRPTPSSFLIWLAQERNIAGASLWVPVPCYLISTEDPQAWRKAIEFVDIRFNLGIDFTELDENVAMQNEKISGARVQLPEVDNSIRKLESNLVLTPEENEKLIKEMDEFLRESD